jgi:starch synthase
MVVPSLYEPCGLTQMIALRYGTVPVVRAVGGLADTVFDWDHSDRPVAERNGFVFDHADFAGLESALRRAIGLWNDAPALFRQLARQGMACDYSWNRPGADYVGVYEWIRHK